MIIRAWRKTQGKTQGSEVYHSPHIHIVNNKNILHVLVPFIFNVDTGRIYSKQLSLCLLFLLYTT